MPESLLTVMGSFVAIFVSYLVALILIARAYQVS